MDDLTHYKRTKIKNKYIQNFPKGILDVIEMDYPNQYHLMSEEDRTLIPSLFSNEEWIDILTKSRNSYRSHIQRMKLLRKNSTHRN